MLLRHSIAIALVAFPSSLLSQETTLDVYHRHDSLAAAARKNGDWAAYAEHIPLLDSILGGHPNARVVRARIAAHLGDTATAYRELRRFAAMGLARNIQADSDLVSLRGTPAWDDIVARLDRNTDPAGDAVPIFELSDPAFVAEDIAWDPAARRWLVTGIHDPSIIAIEPSGRMGSFLRSPDKGKGFFAVAVDPGRRWLWATIEATPVTPGYDSTIAGHASVLKYDLKWGKLLARYDLPVDRTHGAGDIAAAENGDLFVSDSRTGEIRVIRNGGKLELLVPRGEFMSAQGPAIAQDGRHLYIADYVRGLARVDRNSGAVEWLRHGSDVALNGIDGLTLVDSRTLIGVQNGTNPNRLVRISLDASGIVVTATHVIAQSKSIDEPTHGILVGSDYYFIANGGFDSFGDDGKPRQGAHLAAPVIMRIRGLR